MILCDTPRVFLEQNASKRVWSSNQLSENKSFLAVCMSKKKKKPALLEEVFCFSMWSCFCKKKWGERPGVNSGLYLRGTSSPGKEVISLKFKTLGRSNGGMGLPEPIQGG